MQVRGGATAFRQWEQNFLFLSFTAFSPNLSGGNNTVLPPQPHLSGGKLPPLPCGGAAHGADHMMRLAGTVSELFAKMLFFHKAILCERSEDRKILVLNEHCYIFICIGL